MTSRLSPRILLTTILIRRRDLSLIAFVAFGALTGALTFVQPILALVAGLGAFISVLIVLRPDTATLIFLAILYSNAAVIAVQVHGLPFAVGAGFVALLGAPLALRLIVRRERVIATPGSFLLILYFGVLALSAAISDDPGESFVWVATFVTEGFVMFLALTNVVRTKEMLVAGVWTLILVGGAIGALTTYQQVTQTFDDEYLGFARTSAAEIGGPDSQPRLEGPIGEKNRFGQIMLVLLPLGWFRVRDARTLMAQGVAAAATMFIALATALSLSRGAALAVLAMFALLVLLRYVRLKQVVVIGLAIAAVMVTVPGYGMRVGSLAGTQGLIDPEAQSPDTSIVSRSLEGAVAVNMFADAPLLGVGPGLFPRHYDRYATGLQVQLEIDEPFRGDVRQAHSLPLDIAAETGVAGVATFFGLLGTVVAGLWKARQRWARIDPELSRMAVAFLVALWGYGVSGLFLHLSYERYYWVLLALAAVIAWPSFAHGPNTGADRDTGIARRKGECPTNF